MTARHRSHPARTRTAMEIAKELLSMMKRRLPKTPAAAAKFLRDLRSLQAEYRRTATSKGRLSKISRLL